MTYFLEAQSMCSETDDTMSNVAIDVRRARIGEERQCQWMYVSVGGAWGWKSRLNWGDREWAEHLRRQDSQIWILTACGRDAGYYELQRHSDGSVEIVYFGLLKSFIGKGLGGALVRHSIVMARAMGVNRVWLKTSSTDHPNALNNYLRHGMKIVERKELAVVASDKSRTTQVWEANVLGILHNNPWFSVLLQSVRRPDGSSAPHYTIHHERPAVGIVVRDDQDRFLLIHQHRFLVNQFVWAIPSGGVEEGESLVEAAARELKEETGYSCEQWRQLPGYFPTYGCSDQRFELFLAQSPSQTREKFDENEVIGIRWFERDELIGMLLGGKIVDGLSLVLLLHVLLVDSMEQGNPVTLLSREAVEE